MILDHKKTIKKILSENKVDIIKTRDSYRKLYKFIKKGLWDIQEVEWRLVRQLCFRLQEEQEWHILPAIIKLFTHRLAESINYNHLFIFQIFSTFGWREETKFFQPYQNWIFGYPEHWQRFDFKYSVKRINYKFFWCSSFIELVDKAWKLLKNIDNYSITTDGRRLVAMEDYHTKYRF